MYIAVYGNFQGLFFYFQGLSFAFRGEIAQSPHVIFFLASYLFLVNVKKDPLSEFPSSLFMLRVIKLQFCVKSNCVLSQNAINAIRPPSCNTKYCLFNDTKVITYVVRHHERRKP